MEWLREVSYSEYLEYASKYGKVVVEGREIGLEPIAVRRLKPSSEELTDISTTVWSFPARGSWATHRGDYRGNWAPQIPRALIEMYTEPGDLVLDPMIGSGTTCVEARLLGRNCIGVDVNYNAVILALHRLYWLEEYARRWSGLVKPVEVENIEKTWSRIYHGDARRLLLISDDSVDLIAMHPPYWNIIEYGQEEGVEGDLSRARTLEDYLKLMGEVAIELFRVLKRGGYLGVLIGDTRIHRHYVPVSHHVLRVFLETGFLLKEEVIKVQHRMKTTREVWSKVRERDFLLIYHEKLYIFRKPVNPDDAVKHRHSGKT
ncbi:MAG: site-specific DNA-methyltransferase [Desulfurococcaceae archaeon]